MRVRIPPGALVGDAQAVEIAAVANVTGKWRPPVPLQYKRRAGRAVVTERGAP